MTAVIRKRSRNTAENETDPITDGVPMLVARDMARSPEHITALPADLATRMTALTADTPDTCPVIPLRAIGESLESSIAGCAG